MKLFSVFFLLLALVSASSTGGAGADADKNTPNSKKIDIQKKTRSRRKYRYDTRDNGFRIESDVRTETGIDIDSDSNSNSSAQVETTDENKQKSRTKFKWEMHTSGGGFTNSAEIFQRQDDQKARFRFVNRVTEVREYTPTNPDEEEAYQGETAVKTWKLDAWSKPTDVADPNSQEHTITFTTTDGYFSAVAKVQPEAIKAGSITLDPDDIKVDYQLNYPVSVDGNRLVLISKLTTNARSKKRIDSANEKTADDNALDLHDSADSGIGGYFKWVSSLDCDDENNATQTKRNVYSKLDDDGSENKEMQFTFMKARADGNCVWDPVYGLYSIGNGATGNAASTVVLGFSVLFATLMAF